MAVNCTPSESCYVTDLEAKLAITIASVASERWQKLSLSGHRIQVSCIKGLDIPPPLCQTLELP